jgi:hypothetical protein
MIKEFSSELSAEEKRLIIVLNNCLSVVYRFKLNTIKGKLLNESLLDEYTF